MAFRFQSWAWAQAVPASEKLVLLALADMADADTGSCYPSISKLVEKTGLSRSTVKRSLIVLQESALLKKTSRGERTAPLYSLSESSISSGHHEPIATVAMGHHEPQNKSRYKISFNKCNTVLNAKGVSAASGSVVQIPENLTEKIPEFPTLWEERVKASARRPTARAQAKQLALLVKALEEWGVESVLEAVSSATAGGWQGIFPKPCHPPSLGRSGAKTAFRGTSSRISASRERQEDAANFLKSREVVLEDDGTSHTLEEILGKGGDCDS